MKSGFASLRAIIAAALVALCGIASAQTWPARPIRVIIDTTTGSTNDIWSRRYAQRIGEALQQSIVVDNRPGASGTIAAEALAKSPADGYTLYYGGMTALITYPASGGAVRYDPVRDFVPIGMGTMGYPMVVISPRLGVRTLAELVERGRAKPDELTCGTGGHASNQHFACAQFARAIGVKIRTIAYKGGAAALLDAANGEISMAIGWSSELEPFTSAGRLIAVTALAPGRQPKYPDVPTIAEAGFTPVEFSAFSGFFAPAGTPAEVVDRLNAEILKAAQRSDMKEWMDTNGGIYMPLKAADFTTFFRKEQTKWKRMSEETGIRVE